MSAVLRLIKQNTWNEVLSLMQEKYIRVSENDRLAIFNYVAGCDFADQVVCKARGIIIDINAAFMRTPFIAAGLGGGNAAFLLSLAAYVVIYYLLSYVADAADKVRPAPEYGLPVVV